MRPGHCIRLRLLLPPALLLAALQGAACAGSSGAGPPANATASTRQTQLDSVVRPTTPVRAMTLEAPQLMARQTGDAQPGAQTPSGAGGAGQQAGGSVGWMEPDALDRTPPPAAAQAQQPARHHEVFGFAPYWTLPDQQSFDVSNLSTIAYFGVDVTADGSLVQEGAGWSGFQSQPLMDLLARAHASHTSVVLTAKSFDPAVLHALSSNPAATDKLAGQLVQAVRWKGMDGVNLDFEGGSGSDRAGFTAFVARVSQAIHAADPHWQVTLDTYASAALDAAGMVNVAALAPAVDGFFVMAYDMNSSSAPSPTAPLNGRDWNDTRAMTSYLAVVPGPKVILGIPFYGYQWPTSDGSPQARALGGAHAVSYSQLAGARPAVQWDSTSSVPWTAYQDDAGQWWQAYFDDPQSVALKADLADHLGLAGVGVWALGMEGGDREMMAALIGLSPAFKDPLAPTGIARGGAPVFPRAPVTNSSTPAGLPPPRPTTSTSGHPSTAPPPPAQAPPPVQAGPRPTPTPTPVPPPTPTPHLPGPPPPTAQPPPPTAAPPPPPPPIRVEAESMALAASPPTTAPRTVQQGPLWSGGGQLLIQPTAPGQQVSLQLQVPAAGNYQLQVDPSYGPRYGSWTVLVDGRPLGGCNAYAATPASPTMPTATGRVSLAAGTHSLTFVVTGKDPRSTGYLAGIDYIQLVAS